MCDTNENILSRSHEYGEAARSDGERGPRKVPEVREAEPEARGRRVATFRGDITVGTIVMVKVGRNETEVIVTEIGENRWKVKKVGSDREFAVSKIERVLGENPSVPEAEVVETAAPAEPVESEAEPVAEEESDTPSPAPESGRQEKKLSLLDAAAQTLKHSRRPMNTKEIVARIIESGIWTPTGAKTPEQSLYSAIFREIKEKENPRFRKSAEKKGSFEFNR